MRRWRKQTKFGKRGNCMAHALAGLFNVSLRETQHISKAVESDWAKKLRQFANDKGYTWLIISPAFQGLLDGTLYIACGSSPRRKAGRHCVVMEGKKMIFDPHPDNRGLKEVDSIWVFVPLDPQEIET